MKTIEKGKFKLKTAQIIALGFAGVIFIGAFILWLPVSSAEGVETSFIDALFTSTTSVCVTGLVSVSTAANWSVFGKVVIAILIQLGGFGVITCSTILMMVVGRKISIGNRRMIQESYNLDSMSGLAKLIIKIGKGTLLVEGIGATIYCIQFIPEFGFWKGLSISVFNGISSFCNAGMDIIGENSLENYVTNPLVNFTTMALIIMGGIGYVVWWDFFRVYRMVKEDKIPRKRFLQTMELHTKVAIVTSLVLILGGAVIIFVFEANNMKTMGHLNIGESFMASLFQSVTCRTAGFLTVPQDELRLGSSMISMLLMFIGGSPMGTAGGIKTTTICILVLTVITFLRGKTDTEIFGRRVSDNNIRTALVVTMIGFVVLFIATISLSLVVRAPFIDILYELTSAIGTVGLSRGLTPDLPVMGKVIVIITMYIGRIGPLTLAMALMIRSRNRGTGIQLPEQRILIG